MHGKDASLKVQDLANTEVRNILATCLTPHRYSLYGGRLVLPWWGPPYLVIGYSNASEKASRAAKLKYNIYKTRF